MTAYVDDAAIEWKGKERFHLVADSVEELHRFAASVQINRCWFHRGAKYPHYDVTGKQRAAAIAAGAKPVTGRKLVLVASGRGERANTSCEVTKSRCSVSADWQGDVG